MTSLDVPFAEHAQPKGRAFRAPCWAQAISRLGALIFKLKRRIVMRKYVFPALLLAAAPLLLGHKSCNDHSHDGPRPPNAEAGVCMGDRVPCAEVFARTQDCFTPCNLETIAPENGGGFRCVGVGLSCEMIESSDVCARVGCVYGCDSNQDCQSNQNCFEGQCGACLRDSDCRAGQRCRSDHVCVTDDGPDGAPCDRDGQCLNACIEGVCQPRREPGDVCYNPADCESRLCIGGECGCATHAECGEGRRCRSDNVCVTDDGENGAPCSADGQCINACIEGTCADRQPSGGPCDTPADCINRRCDNFFGSTHTDRCIPNDGEGQDGEYCTHNNHCDPDRGYLCLIPPGGSSGECG